MPPWSSQAVGAEVAVTIPPGRRAMPAWRFSSCARSFLRWIWARLGRNPGLHCRHRATLGACRAGDMTVAKISFPLPKSKPEPIFTAWTWRTSPLRRDGRSACPTRTNSIPNLRAFILTKIGGNRFTAHAENIATNVPPEWTAGKSALRGSSSGKTRTCGSGGAAPAALRASPPEYFGKDEGHRSELHLCQNTQTPYVSKREALSCFRAGWLQQDKESRKSGCAHVGCGR